VSWLGRLAEAAGRHRLLTLGAVALITALAVLALPRLRFQTGIYELFPHRPGPIADLAEYGVVFGAEKEVVTLVTGTDPGVVTRAARLTAAELARSPLLQQVRQRVQGMVALGPSLLLLGGTQTWSAVADRLTAPFAPQVKRLRRLLLAPIATNHDALAHDPLGISEIVLAGLESSVDRQTGSFSSRDGRAALVFASPSPRQELQSGGAGGRAQLDLWSELARVKRVVEAHFPSGQISLQFTGAPVYAHYFASTMRRDLTLSSILALCGVVALLLAFFRSVRLLPLAGLIGVLAVCWTLAVAALANSRLNVLALSFAALCIGMGMDALIHILAHTREVGGPPEQRVVLALRSLVPALLAATLTTVAAFLSFSLSAFAGLSLTGLLAACGLCCTMILTLLLVPALGAPVAPARRPTLLDRALAELARRVNAHRVLVLAVAGMLGGGAVWAATGLSFSADLTRLAPPQFPPMQTDLAIARHFERHQHRLIVLARGADQERVLQVNDRVAEELQRLRRLGAVASYRSLSALLPSRATQRARRARLAALNPKQVVERLRGALEQGGLRAEAFEPFYGALTSPRELRLDGLPRTLRPLVRRQLARRSGQWVVATLVYLSAPPTRPTGLQLSGGAELSRVQDSLRRLSTGRVRVHLTGAALAGSQMANLLGSDLLLISLLSLGAVLVLVALLLRRPWPVAATMLSLVWTGVLFAGLLRLLGHELDLYNLMVLPVLIGYGVDDHIYVVRRAVSTGTHSAVVQSGRAVVATTLTSMIALGALLVCELPGLRALGTAAILGLALGLLGALVVMPALLGQGTDDDAGE